MAQQRLNPDTGQWEDDDQIAAADPAQLPGQPAAANTGVAGPAAPAKRAFDRDAWVNGWSGGTPDQLKAYDSQWEGVSTNGDVSTTPTGEMYDRIIGSKNGGTRYGLTPVGGTDGYGGDGRSAAASPAFAANAGSAASGGSSDPFQAQLRAMIMEKLKTLGAPVDANDPTVAAQTTAFRDERTRGADRERAALAERAAFNGTLQGGQSSGSFDTDLQGINEGVSRDTSGFKAQLMGRELESRRGHLAQLLSMAVQTGDAESTRALQLQLAQMDDQIQRMGLAQRGQQFDAQLGENRRQFDDQLGFGVSRASADDLYRNRILAAGGG